MTRLVIWVALASLLATATAAEAVDIRPAVVDECYDYLWDPLDNPQRTACRVAVSDIPDDARDEVLGAYAEISDSAFLQGLLP